jgi:hypothetical protein
MVVGALKKLIFWLGAAKSFNYHPFSHGQLFTAKRYNYPYDHHLV